MEQEGDHQLWWYVIFCIYLFVQTDLYFMIYDACQANGSHCVLMMEPSKTCSKIQLSAALRVLRLAVMDIHDTPHSSHCSLPYIPHSTMIDLIQQNMEWYETMLQHPTYCLTPGEVAMIKWSPWWRDLMVVSPNLSSLCTHFKFEYLPSACEPMKRPRKPSRLPACAKHIQ